MELQYLYYVPYRSTKAYIVTIASAYNQDLDETNIGIAYQGKKDLYDKLTGDTLAQERCQNNPMITHHTTGDAELDKTIEDFNHFNSNSAIVLRMPSHLKKCSRIFTKDQYQDWLGNIKIVQNAIKKHKKTNRKNINETYNYLRRIRGY